MSQRVLVIDDDAEVRRLLELMLRTAGYQVLEAESGPRGLQLMREQSPNLVLCDMVMPEVNGLGVLTAIQADPLLCQIPVLIISATWQSQFADQALASGAVGYITKPFRMAELLRDVKTHMRPVADLGG
jgi:CheY-like chemotaxis protein